MARHRGSTAASARTTARPPRKLTPNVRAWTMRVAGMTRTVSTALAERSRPASRRPRPAASTVTKAEYYYNYAGDDPIDFFDPTGRGVLSFVKGLVEQTLVGAGAGALYGCTVGAIAASELGPLGSIGGCIVSGAAGAEIGAEVAAIDYFESYVGPIPRLRE